MMKDIVTYLSMLLFLTLALVRVQAEIYHWVDANGNSHFSDIAPLIGAQKISIEKQNLMSTSKNQQTIQLKQNKTTEVIQGEYSIKILSPKEDIAIRSNNGTIDINVDIRPELNNNQLLQLFIDGVAFGKSQKSTTIRALNIDRGTHQLQVKLLDNEGNILTKTQVVTVHLQRAAIK